MHIWDKNTYLMPMKKQFIKNMVYREWLPIVMGILWLLSSLCFHRIPSYSEDEFRVVAILFSLLVITRPLMRQGNFSGLFNKLNLFGHTVSFLVVVVFFSSAFVTNDVALLLAIPFVFVYLPRKAGLLIPLLAAAANCGSVISPIGNPQNLFIFSRYHMRLSMFSGEMFFFWAVCFLILIFIALRIDALVSKEKPSPGSIAVERQIGGKSVGFVFILYSLFLLLVILVVLRVLPLYALIFPVAYFLFFNRAAFMVDYGLLLCFIFAFGISDNIIQNLNLGPAHIDKASGFLKAVFLSQILNNVPVTIFLSDLNANWQGLLWGGNVGGFGFLSASFVNFIAYRAFSFYAGNRNHAEFWRSYIATNLLFLAVGFLLFFLTAPSSRPYWQ